MRIRIVQLRRFFLLLFTCSCVWLSGETKGAGDKETSPAKKSTVKASPTSEKTAPEPGAQAPAAGQKAGVLARNQRAFKNLFAFKKKKKSARPRQAKKVKKGKSTTEPTIVRTEVEGLGPITIPTPEELKAEFAAAKQSYLEGEYGTAAQQFERFLEKDSTGKNPLNAAACYYRAECLRQIDAIEEAKAAYREVIEKYKDDFWSNAARFDLALIEKKERASKEKPEAATGTTEKIDIDKVLGITKVGRGKEVAGAHGKATEAIGKEGQPTPPATIEGGTGQEEPAPAEKPAEKAAPIQGTQEEAAPAESPKEEAAPAEEPAPAQGPEKEVAPTGPPAEETKKPPSSKKPEEAAPAPEEAPDGPPEEAPQKAPQEAPMELPE